LEFPNCLAIIIINYTPDIKHQPSEVWLSPTGSITLVLQLRENLLLCSSYLPLGVPNGV
jgi:hypothetical protein